MEATNFAPGFCSQQKEITQHGLKIEGKFPEWLEGSLFRTGPAVFELEHQDYKHWFDGLAMIYKYQFKNGQVDFACKFLKSKAYQEAKSTGYVSVKEWATDPCKSIFEKAMAYVSAPPLTDNGNINIIRYDDELMATSETPLPIHFDMDSLETLGYEPYDDELEGQIDPAHPHYRDGDTYSYLLKYHLVSKYQIYRMKKGSRKREVLATIETKHPCYMHSFAMTENYLILAEIPFTVNPIGMKFGDKPLMDSYHWQPDKGVLYQVLDLRDGSIKTYTGDAYFCFHHVNAYEEGSKLILDLLAFENADVVEALYLKNLRCNEPTDAAAHLSRVVIDLSTDLKPAFSRLSTKLVELPSINYDQYSGRPYRFMYGAGNTQPGNWLDDITKIDAQTRDHWVWYEKDAYPSEPIFVPAPDAKEEDDGVLLSVVLDAQAKNTYLLVLDARNLKVLAKARVPEVLPFTFHGVYCKDKVTV